jgi:hypothetical protein
MNECKYCDHSKQVTATFGKQTVAVNLYACKLKARYLYDTVCRINRFVPRQHQKLSGR